MSEKSTKKLRYQQAIGLAIEEEMNRDPRVFAMGAASRHCTGRWRGHVPSIPRRSGPARGAALDSQRSLSLLHHGGRGGA
jgi:hypothetical protein